MVAEDGFEPSAADYEIAILPLNYSAISVFMIPLSEAIVAEQLELVRTPFGGYADVEERGVLYELVEVQGRLWLIVGVFLPVGGKVGRLLDEADDLLPQGGYCILASCQRVEVRCQAEHVVRGL